MSLTIAIALLVCIIGAVVYMIQTPPPQRYAHLGLAAFLVGLWWVLAAFSGHVAHFGP